MRDNNALKVSTINKGISWDEKPVWEVAEYLATYMQVLLFASPDMGDRGIRYLEQTGDFSPI
jgi:hypothetical protein